MINKHFEAMNKKWDRFSGVNFYEKITSILEPNRTQDLKYVRRVIADIVGEDKAQKIEDTVLAAILITGNYYKKGKETITLSKEQALRILSKKIDYMDVRQLNLNNRCIYMVIPDGLLTITDHIGDILEVEGFYVFSKNEERLSHNALPNVLVICSVVQSQGTYGMTYLSFPYGLEGNLFDYYAHFTKEINVNKNAYKMEEVLEFAVNTINELNLKDKEW